MSPVEYLEAAKLEDIAADLARQGFEVTREPAGADSDFDLVARRGDRVIAVEVKARSSLGDSAAQIAGLRKRALERGYSEFRLVVVNPPREAHIEIDRLCDVLAEHLTNQAFPESLDEVSTRTIIEGVTDLEIDSLEIDERGIHVVGSGSVDVELNYGGGEERDGLTTSSAFPFSFDVVLDHKLHIQEVGSIDVDTSSFRE